MHSAAALPSATGLIITYARLCAALMTRIPPCRCFALGVDPGKATRVVLWCTAMSGVMIYPIPSMSQCECDCLWDASQCVSYALLSLTRFDTYSQYRLVKQAMCVCVCV